MARNQINIINMWCTTRICTWSNSIHYLHAAFGWHNWELWNAVSHLCRCLLIIHHFRSFWHQSDSFKYGNFDWWHPWLVLGFYAKTQWLKNLMMIISSKCRLSVHLDHIRIGESSISPSETVGNLCVIMDSSYTMVSHINHKVQESFLRTRGLSQ